MTQPTIAQLRNLTDRAASGLTPDEQQRLRDGIDQLHRELDHARAEANQYAEAESADAAAGSYAGRAEQAERQLRESQWRHQDAERRVRCQRERAEQAEARIQAVLDLHQPMPRGPFTICAHCSGWTGRRCLGVVTEYPCPTVTALTEETP